MDNIVIRIRNRHAQLMTKSFIVNGNTDYVVAFDFDSEWNAYTEKTARFVYCDKRGARRWIDIPIEDGICHVPKLERTDQVEVGIYAGNIRTTTGAVIPCIWSIIDFKGEKSIHRDFYNECMKLLHIYQNDHRLQEAAYKALKEYWDTVIGGG